LGWWLCYSIDKCEHVAGAFGALLKSASRLIPSGNPPKPVVPLCRRRAIKGRIVPGIQKCPAACADPVRRKTMSETVGRNIVAQVPIHSADGRPMFM
jgi:hypothetical protein